MKILTDFQICMGVPLILEAKFGDDPLCSWKKSEEAVVCRFSSE